MAIIPYAGAALSVPGRCVCGRLMAKLIKHIQPTGTTYKVGFGVKVSSYPPSFSTWGTAEVGAYHPPIT